jgi:hypothetical protein
VNHLKHGTIAVGAPGSEARLQAELEDATKGSSSPDFWNAYEDLVNFYKEAFGLMPPPARAMVDLFLEANGWEALP